MKKKRKGIIARRGKYAAAFLAPALILHVIFGLYPIIYSFFISLTDWTFGQDVQFVGFDNYVQLITTDPYFWKSIGNTLMLMAMYIPVSLIVALLLANLIFQKGTRFKRFLQISFFLPNVTNAVAIGLIFALLFDWQTGVLNQILIQLGIIKEGINWLGQAGTARLVTALMLFWAYFGYCIVFYLAGMSSISEDLYEAAKLDGANGWQLLTRITLPQLKPTTSFLLLTSFISGSQVMAEPQLLLNGWASGGQAVGGPDRSCLTVVWYLYDVAFGNGTKLQYGKGAAIGYVSFVLIMGCVLIWNVVQGVLAKRRGDAEA